MSKKVMVVDDSALSRTMLRNQVDSFEGVEVAYAAPNAKLGLSYLEKHTLDLVMLDVEMPEIDGIEALRRIRAKHPKLPVLMCSSLTSRGAEVTLRALSEGASDYIPKPGLGVSPDQFQADLSTKVRALLQLDVPTKRPVAAVRPRPTNRVRPAKIEALAIGCSTGGPAALATFFEALKGPLKFPLFIVQHMPAVFTGLLAERLATSSGLLVKEGEDEESVRGGVCYLAPGGRHMTVDGGKGNPIIRLTDEAPENFCRPAVDVLFRGLAAVYGGAVLASIFTGMGTDGTLGCGVLAEHGARILIQDPASCVVPSMPNGVKNAGIADAELSLEEIADAYQQVSLMNGMAATLSKVRGVG